MAQHSPHPDYGEFVRLFETFRAAVHSYILAVTKDDYAAEELTQELFINLWRKRDSYDSIHNMDQYIFRMAHNACMNWFRKLALDARLVSEMKLRLRLEENNVEDHMAAGEAKKLLAQALETLSPQRRKVYELSRQQGLKVPEIADILHISVHTANHHLVDALAHIRKYFTEHTKNKAVLVLLYAML